MASTAENRSGSGDIVEEARNEVREKLEKAEKTSQSKEEEKKKKEEIAKKVKRELEELVEEVERTKKEGKEIRSETKRELVYTLAKALELADQQLIEIPTEAKELLKKLARAHPSDTTLSAIGTSLSPYLLGKKNMVVDGKFTDDFLQRFKNLITSNPNAANLIRDQIIAQPENFGIIREEILKLLPEEEKKSEDNLSEKLGLRGRKSQRTMTLEERKKLESFNHRIGELIKHKFSTGEINLSTIAKINQALIAPILSEEQQEILRKLGLSQEDLREYIELKKEYFQFPDFSYLLWHSPASAHLIEAAEKEFSDLSGYFSTHPEKGTIQLSREARLKFSELIKKYYYLLLKPVIADKSKSFHENFSHHHEVQSALSILRQIVSLSCEKIIEILPKDEDDTELREIVNFFKDKGEGYQSRIFTYMSLFHDLPLNARSLGSIEKIKGFFSFLFPSQLAEFFDDETGFMQMSRDLLTMTIREYLIEGGNTYRGDLLSGKYTEVGVRWNRWFREERYEYKLKELAQKLNLLGKDDDWKLEMAAAFSEGVGIATLIDGEVLSTSDPVPHFKEVHPLMSFLSPKHNWRGGRGRDAPGKISRFLLHMDVQLFPEIRPWSERLWSKKKWVPEEFADWVDRAIKTYGEKFVENFFDIGGSYQELLGLFNIPNSINSWNGWRIDGMMPEKLKKILKIFVLDEYTDFWKKLSLTDFLIKWKEIIDYTGQIYGASGIWNSIGGVVGGAGVKRLESELKKFLLDYYQNDIDKVDAHFGEFFDQQKGMVGNRGRERLFKLEGEEGRLSLFEIRQIRLNQLRGEAFFRYLRRNPADFLMITTQLCPELLDEKTHIFKSEAEIKALSDISKLEKQKILERQKELRIRWGENFEVLRNLHRWLMVQKGSGYKSIKDFIKDFNAGTIEAYERHKTREEKVRREIIKIACDPKLSEEEKKTMMEECFKLLSFYLKDTDFTNEGKKFWELFSGEGGLFKTITGIDFTEADTYFSKFGSYKNAGEKNFFFTMAQSWFIKNGDLNPFHADFPYYDVFEQLGTPGESTFARVIDANIAAYKEVVSQITTLEDLLLEAARTGKMDKIYELHQKITNNLSGIIGPEYAFRANFVLTQVVAKFFMERSILRDPKWKLLGPIGWLARNAFGTRISLSKLLTDDLHAFSMDNNALRTYFLKLQQLNVLPTKGLWSKEHLEDVFEVAKGEFIAGDVAPSFLWFIVLYLLFSYIKKAIEEIEEKKK